MTTIAEHDQYLSERTGCYEYREVRYSAAASKLLAIGLTERSTVYDIGAGMTEFDYHLRSAHGWRGRYIPIDGSIDGTDLNTWYPPRIATHAVALELLEHLYEPRRLVDVLQAKMTSSVVVSVPNPRTVDVLGIDPTHVSIITAEMLETWGFRVEERTFYGGVLSNGEPDALLGVWRP